MYGFMFGLICVGSPGPRLVPERAGETMNARVLIVFFIIGAQACSSAAKKAKDDPPETSFVAPRLDNLPPVAWWHSTGPVRSGVGVVYGDGGWPVGVVTVVENNGDEPIKCSAQPSARGT